MLQFLLTTIFIVASVESLTFEECRSERVKCAEGDYLCNCPATKETVWSININVTNHCLPKAYVICRHGRSSCPGGQDEACTCKLFEFQCGCSSRTSGCYGGLGCYTQQQICDGVYDCLDGTDEVNCTCPSWKFECACYRNNSCSGLVGCLPDHKVCDGTDDCKDGSDEKNCTVLAVTKQNTTCSRSPIQCNGIADCATGADERNCSSENNCVQSVVGSSLGNFQCNGLNDCGDWSDEANCTCPVDTFYCRCGNQECAFYRGCLPLSLKCNGIVNCLNGSDESNCTRGICPGNLQTLCPDYSTCYEPNQRCDGVFDCSDHSDEANCTCGVDQVMCGCIYDKTTCPTVGRCIHKTWVSDGFVDCPDGSDEPCHIIGNKISFTCNFNLVECRSPENVTQLLANQPVNQTGCIRQKGPCKDRLDEQCDQDYWLCIIPLCRNVSSDSLVLYKHAQGIDLSLLMFCPTIINSRYALEAQPGFKCLGKWVTFPCALSQPNLYDAEAQCADKSDVCFVNGEFRCFLCLDKKLVIGRHQVCDGVVDCYDLSDECLCQDQSICNAVLGDSQSTCSPGQMHCYNDTDCLNIDNVLCNQAIGCAGKRNTKYCYPIQNSTWCKPFHHAQELSISARCDGRPECTNASDECTNCPNTPAFCNNTKFLDIAFNFYVCYGQDPHGYNESLCPNRFLCKNGPLTSIDVMNLCDAVYDCDDHSDESVQLCAKKRFYCLNGQPLSVPISQKEDGIWDCSDGSDECPPVSSRNTIFSNQKEMIANPVLGAFIWIMGLLALIGNLVVCVTTARDLWMNRNSQNLVNKSMQILIFNLSFADFLMGIYLLGIAITSVYFSGQYCFFDAIWRSGPKCSFLGAIAIISTETSALSLALITVYRIVSVRNPFMIRSLKPMWIGLACVGAWITSIVIAVIPVIDFASGYFVSHVWFPNFFYRRDFVAYKEIMALATRMSRYNVSVSSWHDARSAINLKFANRPIMGEFGYYSQTSVCLPSLFVTVQNQAWEYSLFLITLNFLLFLFMVAGYLYIYRRSNRMSDSKSTDTSTEMQRKISRLLVTDFCCWIPVCTLGFVALGGVNLPTSVYAFAAAVLLPINSALNPVLYSSIIDKALSCCSKPQDTSVNTVRTNTDK